MARKCMAEIVKAKIQNSRILKNAPESNFDVRKSHNLSIPVIAGKYEFRLFNSPALF